MTKSKSIFILCLAILIAIFSGCSTQENNSMPELQTNTTVADTDEITTEEKKGSETVTENKSSLETTIIKSETTSNKSSNSDTTTKPAEQKSAGRTTTKKQSETTTKKVDSQTTATNRETTKAVVATKKETTTKKQTTTEKPFDINYWVNYAKELQPADNYLPTDDVHHITVSENEQIIEITAVNDRIPELKTTATIDGEKKICATETFTLVDTVEYKHLIPNKEYMLKGVLMDKTTGKELIINGETVTAKTVFIPTEPSGTATVEFTFDAKYIKADTDIVVFESLYKDGKELAVHADIEDEGQTVTVKAPEIKTTAKANGKKEITAKGEITIDDVVEYKHLIPGKEYKIVGTLMDKSTGKPFEVDGKIVTSELTFIPEKSSGKVTVSFTFDSSAIKETTELVVFETLYREGVEIAVHADIDDEGQTVKINVPAPVKPSTPKTGDDRNYSVWIGLGAIAIGGAISAVILKIKSKKDEEED